MTRNQPCGVYRLYDVAGVLLYVGSSRRPETRIKNHLGQGSTIHGAALIRERTTQHTVVMYLDEESAQTAERAAIYAERPLFNRMHNHKRFLRMDGDYYPVDYDVWLTGPAGRIMRRMAEMGLTWEQMSRMTGVTAVQLGHIPNRRIDRVKPHELVAIERVLGISLDTEERAA